MKLGSLFSGAGIGDLGWLMAGFDIRWQVEIEEYCQKVLELRYPETKKYRDIKTLDTKSLESVDIVVGGFPCQPFSVAGKQRGDSDDRNLWPHMLRVIKGVRPAWVVGENVPGIIPLYLDTVLADLEGEGYACRTFVFPAHALGASHRRDRIWMVGYAGRERQKKHEQQAAGIKQSSQDVADAANAGIEGMREREKSTDENVADAAEQRLQKPRQTGERKLQKENKGGLDYRSVFQGWREAESRVCRVTDGCPKRVDRLKSLGNGQVMACTAFIGSVIMDFEEINIARLWHKRKWRCTHGE